MVYIFPDTRMICGLCGLAMYRFTTLSNHYHPRTKKDSDIRCKEYGKWKSEMSIWNRVEVSHSCGCLICQKVNIIQSNFHLGCVGSQLEYHQPQQQGIARMKMKEEEEKR